ncbi:DUF4013 domain-containing protein [Halorussus halophilus]|uniref:DUF4013 domain-containing protein n=1 Tax=Halorussus halophilus TaxID=2650975 RepID=UPI00130173AF|nr:DUF4013 domain-containing protein [Halorussus halophilus]
MIRDSIDYLTDSDTGMTTVVLGGLLTLFGIFIIPALVVEGYLVRVLHETERGNTEAPTFSKWVRLAVDGLKAVVIGIVYGLVPAVIAMVFAGSGALMLSGGNADFLGGVTFLFGSLLTLFAIVAVWYVYPAAIARFAEKESMSAAFHFSALRPIVTKEAYATGWLMALVVLLVGGIVVSLLAVVPILGWIGAVFVAFYAQVAAYYIYGRAYGEASGMAPGEETPVEGEQPVV